MRILVTGATGKIGRHLIDELQRTGHQVRALTRTPDQADLPDGVEVVPGDLINATTLEDAFDGIDALHLITFGGDQMEDLTNGKEIVTLAESHGITRATVLAGWAPTSIEEALSVSAIAWSRLEPVEVMVNALEWSDEIRNAGTVSMLANYPSAMVHEADIAAVAALALTSAGHEGRAYSLTGPEALTAEQRTRVIGDATGRELTFVQLSEAEERSRLASYGYDDEYVEFGIELALDPPPAAGHVLSTVEDLTGRPARTFTQWAEENADQFKTATWPT